MNPGTNTAPDRVIRIAKTTTARREWLGWSGILLWMYLLVNNYADYLPYSGYTPNDIFWSVLLFELFFALSVLVVSFRFGRDPDGLSRLAVYTTPAAMLLTASFMLMPAPFHSAAYVLSGVFIAPALARVAYGVLRTARPGCAAMIYMSGLAAAFFIARFDFRLGDYFLEVLMASSPPSKALFMAYALFLAPAWFASRRRIAAPDISRQGNTGSGLSKQLVLALAAAFVLLAWLHRMCDFINYSVEQFDDILYIPLYDVMPSIVYVLLGLTADKKREKPVVLIGLALYLISIMLAFLLGDPTTDKNAAVISLLFTNRFMQLVTEYFVYTIPIFFFLYVKRPVFVAAAGTALYMLRRMLSWIVLHRFSDLFAVAGAPLFAASGVAAVLLLWLLHFFFERRREKTLAATLYSLLYDDGEPFATAAVAPPEPGVINALFTPEEQQVVQMLMEGNPLPVITQRLNLSSTEAHRRFNAVQSKVARAVGGQPGREAIFERYGLTGREREVAAHLLAGMQIKDIPAALEISRSTVNFHSVNLYRKLNVQSRAELIILFAGGVPESAEAEETVETEF